jgi:LmbE family N-acetylglucosaminyl deacetylase
MKKLRFLHRSASPSKILCLGAHSDDIEIGCGGTILRFLREEQGTEVRWIVFSARGSRAGEARKSARLFLGDAKRKRVSIENFKDGFFPYIGYGIKTYFEKIKKAYSPDIIFTHFRHDLHQDHRLISELTWNTFRDHFILEYEVVKYDGDLGTPNFFVHLGKDIAAKKIEYLNRCFKTQGQRKWFTDDSFFAILRLRGIESNAPETYAEGFHCRKAIY